MADGAIIITLPPDMDPAQRDDVLEALDLSGADLKIETASAAQEASPATLVESEIRAVLEASPDLPAALGRWWDAVKVATNDGGATALLSVAFVLIGAYALERVVMTMLMPRFQPRPGESADALFSVRLKAALRWAAGRALALFLFYLFARIGANLFLNRAPAVWGVVGAIGWSVFSARVYFNVLEFLAGSLDARRRMVPLSDTDGAFIRRATFAVLTAIAILTSASRFLVDVVQAGAAAKLPALLGIGMILVAVFTFLFVIRRPVARVIRETFQHSDGSLSRGVALFAGGWHVLYALFALINNLARVSAVLVAKGAEAAESSSYSFLILVLAPFMVGACNALFTEWAERLKVEGEAARKRAQEEAAEAARIAAARHGEAVAKAEADGLEAPPAPAPIEFGHESDVADRIGTAAAMRALSHGAILIGATALILIAWNVDPFTRTGEGFAGRFIPSLVSALAALVVGWSIWRGVEALIDMHAPAAPDESEDVSGEGMGQQGSRLETLVPVLRTVAKITIGSVAIMTALTAMGVNIGPLLAGAGVVGLAVGFGAQTMVKDVISGALYLYEDAFRVGEYIVAGPGKGVVENISLRSVRLRHHRGAVYTIPFGSLGTVQNHSRDWVKVKFELHVPHDTDLERVRKLIKKIGQEMLENEQYGQNFIEPVKSQGVVRVDDLGFVIGVKFTSKPGEQFLIRRDAYTRIKQAFSDNGIEFSTPRVLVDAGDADADRDGALGSAERRAIAAAAMQREPAGGRPGGDEPAG